LLDLCDRVMVMCQGQVTGIADARKISKDQVGLMMTGLTYREAVNSVKTDSMVNESGKGAGAR
ncbi:MAG: ral nucleoside transport system ATP-binding protein, partial [Clostridiales bacterium]|nr:ral nucleoside transport system ATP-binding protein [Clostridiales bacterium]